MSQISNETSGEAASAAPCSAFLPDDQALLSILAKTDGAALDPERIMRGREWETTLEIAARVLSPTVISSECVVALHQLMLGLTNEDILAGTGWSVTNGQLTGPGRYPASGLDYRTLARQIVDQCITGSGHTYFNLTLGEISTAANWEDLRAEYEELPEEAVPMTKPELWGHSSAVGDFKMWEGEVAELRKVLNHRPTPSKMWIRHPDGSTEFSGERGEPADIRDILEAHFGDNQQAYREVLRVTSVVRLDPRFPVWPASIGKHHDETGGLHLHTAEVLKFALAAANAYPGAVDHVALAVGAIWHDAGKMDEYAVKPIGEGYHRATPLVPHIAHGLASWAFAAKRLNTSPQLAEHVTHLIASHHGRREWGSPVEPRTLEALILHHADMQSVMMESGTNPQTR